MKGTATTETITATIKMHRSYVDNDESLESTMREIYSACDNAVVLRITQFVQMTYDDRVVSWEVVGRVAHERDVVHLTASLYRRRFKIDDTAIAVDFFKDGDVIPDPVPDLVG